MILPRSLYNDSPPEPRTRATNNPTLLYSWWCTIFSLVIIGFRLSGRYIRNERLFREDWITLWSTLPLIARMGFVHVVLIYGTNNVNTSHLTDPIRIRHREIGSQMVLAARIFYALFIWMAKFTVSEFLKRLTERFWKKGYEWGLRCIRIFLVVTFIMVVIATFAECQPVDHYWQVIPSPTPECRQGYAQLLTMGIADMITDILLVAFPIPIIVRSNMSMKRKVSLVALFSLSIVLIAITGARMPMVINRSGLQQFRTVFASSEILAATVVSNAIILGSFLRDRGVKKAKFKAPSTCDSIERRGSMRRYTARQWGSDEDLARSLGYRTKPELADKTSSVPRPAPVADLDLLPPSRQSGPFANNNWQFPSQNGGVQPCNSNTSMKITDIRDPMPSPRHGRRVSFFDVGGLLENSVSAPSPTDSVVAHDFAPHPRRGSRASTLMSNGRAYPPAVRRSSRLSQQSEDHELSIRPSNQLQDIGGFLSEDHELAMEAEEQASSSPHSVSPTSSPPQTGQTAPVHRTLTQTSYDAPSLQDAGGLLLPRPSMSIQSNPTQPNYDAPSLQDAGGLLSSSPHSKHFPLA
ncbi:hypothetical protein P153DRAFT_338475 [Dothidotthia symphoricarpi CBS 119687]|uniref:Rhodopsin domain-containing protein n=1 Tax=Dothidotthia symphoricarpi CBS 119687 TaxID=1392245 RepID=A0A6A6AJE2_9PLEO|nr:uncharacterized protein P153DRAFT_338475 [Dothidotthia symphoricarpi CBS 119687]KAF2130561.1 hypothetical protein P153DRAFT_338475 [Dothidotthia symphoricarpi CBS 119687]